MSYRNKGIWTKSTGCVQGIEEYKLAGTQGTCKGLVRENWKSMLRHREFCARGGFGASFTGGQGAIKYLKVRE